MRMLSAQCIYSIWMTLRGSMTLKKERAFQRIPAACSVGVAIWDLKEPIQAVLEKADQALYQAKTGNKGGCRLWKKQIYGDECGVFDTAEGRGIVWQSHFHCPPPNLR